MLKLILQGEKMGADVIGKVKSRKNKSYEVKWDKASGEVYVSYAGVSKVDGKASSAGEAMTKAEAWLYDK